MAAGQSGSPKTHRLEATPATVAYGYYWSEAKPVLRIASGDIIDVDTLLTSTPDRLEKAGVPADEDPGVARAIVDQVKDRGPGGHILTGPVLRRRRRARRRARGQVLSIDLPIDYGYNGCSGFVRENCAAGAGPRIIRSIGKTHDGGVCAGDRDSAASRSSAAWASRRRRSADASAAARRAFMPAISTTRSSSPARRSSFPCTCPARSSRSATATPRRATAKSIRRRSKRRCADACSSPSARA